MDKSLYLEKNISQQPAIDLLRSMGYTYISPEDCEVQRGSRYHVLLKDILRGQLRRLNRYAFAGAENEFSAANIERAMEDLDEPLTDGLVRTSEKIYDALLLGKSYPETVGEGKTLSFNLKYIDWEYPGTSLAGIASDRSDKENYTLLLAELRKTLDTYREGMLVTTAVGGDVYFALQTDMKEASRYLDYVQLMTYDLQGGFQKVTGHHAALYHSEGNLFDACVEKAVNGFANAGVPMEKLILGVPFYSRKWDGVKGAGCRNGLGMEAETVGGYGGDYGELKESWIGKRGFIRYWDEQAKVPYLFDGETFISYEDCESLGVKIAYLKEKGMGGIMFWEYKCDPSGELLSFIKKNM